MTETDVFATPPTVVDAGFAYRGACFKCGFWDARHRVFDHIYREWHADRDRAHVAEDFDVTQEVVDVIVARWSPTSRTWRAAS